MLTSRKMLASAALALLLAAPATCSAADSAADEIHGVLTQWTKQFNAGNVDAVCKLFAPELRYDFRGYPERGYDDVCTLLRRSLADASKRYAYDLEIREIIVEGDLAVVRLTWALTVTLPNGQTVTSKEPGMDVLRKGPDGQWKIVRYIAYEAPERPTSSGQ